MNIRWEKRVPDRIGDGKRVRLVARLVDGSHGKPAEKIIADLGVIEERFLKARIFKLRDFHHGLFWSVAGKKLDHILMHPEDRKRIEAELCEIVPKPSDEWALWGVTCIPRFDPE